MSEATQEVEREAIELPRQGDLAFNALMDALAPEEEDAGSGAAENADASAAGSAGATAKTGAARSGTTTTTPATGRAPASGSGDGKAGQPAQPTAGRTEGTPAGDSEQPAAEGGDPNLPADWTASPDDLIPKLGQLSTKLEENLVNAYQRQAYDQAKEDYGRYFEALEKHPRLLIGTEVPAIGKEGMERLRDSNDAKEWQEAVRSLLIQEIKDAAETKMGESRQFLETIHASIDLFKNNKDLIPGTRTFNVELANEFARMAQPYEIRHEGKLQGYSIPVQPIIDSLRKQIEAKTVKALPTPAPAAPVKKATEPPQAGISSKAGSTTEKEDFSVLFGTIGLPNLQI